MVMTRSVTDGSDGSGECKVSGIIIVIDFEKDQVAVGFERAEVVFSVRVIGVAEVVVDFDGRDDARDCFGAEGGNASPSGPRDRLVLPQFIVERANPRSLGVHD